MDFRELTTLHFKVRDPNRLGDDDSLLWRKPVEQVYQTRSVGGIAGDFDVAALD